MTIKDSGERREFETGAVRDMSAGKGRFDLLCPFTLGALAKHMEAGSLKYGDRNWEKGIPDSSFYDSAMRHLTKWAASETDEDHLVAALWNIHCLVSQRERRSRFLLSRHLTGFAADYPATVFEAQYQDDFANDPLEALDSPAEDPLEAYRNSDNATATKIHDYHRGDPAESIREARRLHWIEEHGQESIDLCVAEFDFDDPPFCSADVRCNSAECERLWAAVVHP